MTRFFELSCCECGMSVDFKDEHDNYFCESCKKKEVAKEKSEEMAMRGDYERDLRKDERNE